MTQLALWAAAFALLLRAAVPLAASAAADGRGAALFEVCSAYGVAPAAGADTRDGLPADGSAADPCALAFLLGAGTPPATPLALPPGGSAAATGQPLALHGAPHDDAARWIARLHHGPPAFA